MKGHLNGPELSEYLDGTLAPERIEMLEFHMSSCSDCRDELASLRHLKLAFASASRKNMPADLAVSLADRFVRGKTPFRWRAQPKPLWAAAGAFTIVAMAVSVWLRSAATLDEIPLEPLLAAHARYSAEALVPQDNLVSSNYSDQLSDLADGSDSEIQ